MLQGMLCLQITVATRNKLIIWTLTKQLTRLLSSLRSAKPIQGRWTNSVPEVMEVLASYNMKEDKKKDIWL